LKLGVVTLFGNGAMQLQGIIWCHWISSDLSLKFWILSFQKKKIEFYVVTLKVPEAFSSSKPTQNCHFCCIEPYKQGNGFGRNPNAGYCIVARYFCFLNIMKFVLKNGSYTLFSQEDVLIARKTRQ